MSSISKPQLHLLLKHWSEITKIENGRAGTTLEGNSLLTIKLISGCDREARTSSHSYQLRVSKHSAMFPGWSETSRICDRGYKQFLISATHHNWLYLMINLFWSVHVKCLHWTSKDKELFLSIVGIRFMKRIKKLACEWQMFPWVSQAQSNSWSRKEIGYWLSTWYAS